MIARRFDIGEDLPLPLARLVWAWEEKRGPGGCATRAAFPLLRLPGSGARAAFLLAPAGEDGYAVRLAGADCPPDLLDAPGSALADAAFEAWLVLAPMTIESAAWRAILVPLADGDTHVVLGLVAAKDAAAREAA
ncbi:MAG: hypothetical protein NBV67_02635 [Tagaea sp.]|nr:hypothetical protein [Tagaea sp.]